MGRKTGSGDRRAGGADPVRTSADPWRHGAGVEFQALCGLREA